MLYLTVVEPVRCSIAGSSASISKELDGSLTPLKQCYGWTEQGAAQRVMSHIVEIVNLSNKHDGKYK